ncbi:MAG: iron ABC transporter permease [Abditibacteriota bacterium]|nr:iron ABC transporter permease [Abditibacteriota bacterium]
MLWLLLTICLIAAAVLCTAAGSVSVPAGKVLEAVGDLLAGRNSHTAYYSIITEIRLPRVLCTALTGAALALAGGAMQGLLRNPLADGSTLGVSSGAALGAILAIAARFSLFEGLGTAMSAILCAFLSLLIIMSLAYKIDCSLSTNTIILIGVIFTMFAGSITSLLITFAGDRIKTIMFWTMGSLAGSGYGDCLLLLVSLALFGAGILWHCEELNAFSAGEENARHIGIDVRRVKLIILICVSGLIGASVSVGGTIGFAGLVIPHMTRLVIGANHKRLLPACVFAGAIFLMLADLLARVIMRPLELPIGVITSFVGSIVFVYIFYHSSRLR